jgi:hypothetical protein
VNKRNVRKKWQQLKVSAGSDGSLLFDDLLGEAVQEIWKLAGENHITTEHLGWLGWELVTVCKGWMYYKREVIED